MTQEEKAKRYDEALEELRGLLEGIREEKCKILEEDITSIFPELKESEDERILKHLKAVVKAYDMWAERGLDMNDIIAWLEKKGDIDKATYEIAEKEKCDFVSGQYIECRKSFDVFKEDNSYWFDYVGNDTYIGRSDNILNKKFHITPKQLYRLFTQQHCPKENNINEETNVLI